MNKRKTINKIRASRGKRARAKISGTGEKPRLSVFRSNRYIYAQLIDDEKGRTVASFSVIGLKKSSAQNAKSVQAEKVGEEIAKKALAAGIKQAIFDRSSYKYHGRVKAVAEGARKGGLKI
ncbi:MAG: 50S ribosomal protein L18 [Candidatus Liptonbacteria bacterium]|nr:50S ribosomal protein L18 [Candidatus Liptonbacteria bacterium]